MKKQWVDCAIEEDADTKIKHVEIKIRQHPNFTLAYDSEASGEGEVR